MARSPSPLPAETTSSSQTREDSGSCRPLSLLASLARLCDGEQRKIDSCVSHPRGLTTPAGVRWLVASDGHVMAARVSDALAPELVSERRDPTLAYILAAFQSSSSTDDRHVSLAALRDAAGPAEFPREAECDRCGGAGTDECTLCGQDTHCDDCGGDGKVIRYPECRTISVGSVGQALANAALLAMGLDAVQAPADGTVRMRAPAFPDPIVIVGDEWLVVLMPLRYPTSDHPTTRVLTEVWS